MNNLDKFLLKHGILLSIADKVTDVWSDVCHTFRQLKRIYEYLPILWQDEDWDFHYLITLMHFKLDRMQKEIEGQNRLLHSKKYARQIRVAMRHLSEAFLVDDIDEAYSDALNTWWDSRTEVTLPNGYVQMGWDHEDEESKKLDRRLNRYRKRKEAKFKYHFSEFIRLFHRNLQKWWD